MMARLRLIGIAGLLVAALIATSGQAFALPPTVTSISPNSGSTSGQSSILCPGIISTTITGTNFTTATSVTIGGTPATGLSVIDDKHIRVCAPVGVPGVADVTVTNPDGTGVGANLYTYFSGGPSISTVGPSFGLTTGGNQIFISGSNFVPGTKSDGTTATTVTIGGNPATNVVVNSTGSLTATVPAGTAGVANVTVTTAGGSAGGNLYTYFAPALPTVTSITPNGGSMPSGTINGGIAVDIKGSGFIGADAPGGSVAIGGITVTGVIVKSNGEITASTPSRISLPPSAQTGPKDVVVTVPGGGTGGTGNGLFTYVYPAPNVAVITPTSGSTAGGTSVTITGQYFFNTTSVTIGGTPVQPGSISVSPDGTQITAVTGAHAPSTGPEDVVVTTTQTNAGNLVSSATGSKLYTYGAPPPDRHVNHSPHRRR
jgi:hypothetical protein